MLPGLVSNQHPLVLRHDLVGYSTQRVFCPFLVSPHNSSPAVRTGQLMNIYSTLEVPILPRTEACTPCKGPNRL